MMAADLQSVQTLCHGCLSADRDLSPIGQLSRMFTKICDRKARVPGLKYTSLCWECTATLKRMQSFHKQVNNAQTILKLYIHNEDLHKPLPKSLSWLKTTITNHNFISLIEPDEPELNIKPSHEIKVEFEHDENEDFKHELKHDEDEDVIENNEMFDYDDDDNNDLLIIKFSEDVKCEEQKNFKAENKKASATTDKPAKGKRRVKLRYDRISTPEEMCVKEPARPSDLVNLWGQDGCIVQGSHASGTHNSNDHDEQKPHVCNVCHACYRTLEELSSHVTSHDVYRCLVCGHRSPSVEAAGRHVTEHSNVVKCLLCEFCCLQPAVAMSHYKIAHSKFLCDYCGKKSPSKLVIQRHISRYHTENKCEQCSRSFPNYERLKAHVKVVHDRADPTWEAFCVKCYKQFKNKIRLDHHLRHSAAHADEYGIGKAKKRVKCLACDKVYVKKASMMLHYKFVHLGIRNYYCSDCDKSFSRSERYNEHRRYKHEGAQRPRDKMCEVCGRGFTENRVLALHMRTHSGERPHACAVCDKRFARPTQRDIHQRKHKTSERVKCLGDGCDKTYTTRTKMMCHYKHVHLGQKYHCGVCDKNFCSSDSYNKHRRHVHEGVERKRDKTCAVCGKRYINFCSSDSYNKHRRHVHEGVERKRDKTCDVCGKRYIDKANLANHMMRAHSRERPHACAVCSKRYATRVDRDAHHKRQHSN